jgi:rsbT antagonist protein RsbS
MSTRAVARVPLQLSRGVVVASLQLDLTVEVLARFRQDLLSYVARTDAVGILLDVSGIEVMDLEEFEDLRRTIDMAKLMGRRTVLAGLQPGVVSSLIALGLDTHSLTTALDLDAGLDLFTGTTS